jgi:hypothetical protein
MMFARPRDMEPGMFFRTYRDGPVLGWLGVEKIISRFAGKDRVRVMILGGDAFVVDAATWLEVVQFGEGK